MRREADLIEHRAAARKARRPVGGRMGAAALLGAALLAAGSPAPARAAEAPFDSGLERLAEILGSLQFLSTLCGAADGGWRAGMEQLLEAEKPDSFRRKRFVSGFNRGFASFAANYRTCTPSARRAIALYRDEGAALVRDLTGRFGN